MRQMNWNKYRYKQIIMRQKIRDNIFTIMEINIDFYLTFKGLHTKPNAAKQEINFNKTLKKLR